MGAAVAVLFPKDPVLPKLLAGPPEFTMQVADAVAKNRGRHPKTEAEFKNTVRQQCDKWTSRQWTIEYNLSMHPCRLLGAAAATAAFFVVAPVAIVGAIFGGAGIAVGMVVPIAAFGVVYTPFDWMASAMETTEELKRAKAWCQTLKNMEGGDSLTRDLFACDDALQLLRLSCEELESSTTPAQTASTPKSTSQ